MPHTKTEWRGALLDARRALPPAVRRRHSATIAERVRALPAFAACRVLLAYEPIGAEVDLTDLCWQAAAGGRHVYVPAPGPAIGWHRWSRGENLGAAQPNAHVPDPSGQGAAVLEAPDASREPALVLVPGVGFDLGATRLGRGAGFYDRALARLRAERSIVAVGLAFEVQLVEILPADSWDQSVDLIVTEARVVTPSASVPIGALLRGGHGVEEVSDS